MEALTYLIDWEAGAVDAQTNLYIPAMHVSDAYNDGWVAAHNAKAEENER